MTDTKRLHEIAQPIFTADIYLMYKDEVLIFKRSDKKKTFPGFWSLPGGHIDEGEDPLAAAIRETKEETGITVTPDSIKLKAIALHHHIDRKELYIAFQFLVTLPQKISPPISSDEGDAQWIKKADIMKLNNIFEPIQYYFPHVLENRPGIIYNRSEWKNSKLVKVLSQTVDTNY